MTPGDINQHHIISKMFSARKAASILECAPDYVSRLCREGKLSGVRHQGQWFVEPQSLKRFQAERVAAKGARSEALASERRQETRAFVYASKGPVGKLVERVKERMPKLELGRHTLAALALSVLLGSSVLASGTLMPKFNAQETPAALGRIESPFFSTTLSSFGDIFNKISALFAPKSIAVETPEIIRTLAGAPVPSAPAVAVNLSTTVSTTTRALSYVTNTYPTTYITNSADLTQYVTYDFLGDQLERVFDTIAGSSGGGGTLSDFSTLVASDIPDLSGVYLALTGGTLSGELVLPYASTTATSTLAGLALADLDCSAYNNGGALTTDSSGNVICSADDSTAGSGSPGGLNTYVQYNDAGSFGGDAGFTYNASQDRLTVSYASTTAITATTASTTNLIVSSISSSLLKTVNGVVTAAVAGSDYQAAGNYATFTYPFPSNATTTQIAFNGGLTAVGATTTALAVTGSTTVSSVLNVGGQLNANVAAVIASTTLVGNTLLTNATTTNLFISELASSSALRTLSATINYASTTNITSSLASTTNLNISGITSGSTQCLQINSSGTVSGTGSACGSGAGSITAIGPLGQTQTGTTITFATSTNGSDFTITATGDTITFNLPIASASNTGKLSATDWVMFNAKLGSTSIDTSAELAALVVDETGSGALVFGTNATLASTTLSGNTLLASATSSTFAITAISGALLKTTAGGSVIPAVAGTDYQVAGNYATFTYPFPSNATTTQIAFNGGLTAVGATTTALAVTGSTTISSVLNVGGVLNANGGVVGNVTGNASTATALETGRTINGVTFDGTANITINAASSTLLADTNSFTGNNIFTRLSSASTTLTGPFVFANATGTNATTTTLYVSGLASTTELRTVTGLINYASSTALTVSGSFYGAGLSDCSISADKLLWNNGQFSCGTDQSGGGGGTDVNWTFFNGSGIRPATTSNQVLIGASATSSLISTLAKLGVVGGASIDYASTTMLTATTASTTNLVVSGIANSLLKTVNGVVTAAVAGVDYAAPGASAFDYPFPSNATTTQIAFNGGLTSASTTLSGPFVFANATGTNATTTSFFATTASSTNLFSNSATLNAATIGSLTLNNALGVAQGGTGSTTLGGLLSGNGTSIYSSATTSASCSSGVSCSAFTVLGAGPVSITNSGVTSLAGTANQITASASTGAITLSLPSHVIFPSSFQAAAASTTNATTTNLAITDVTSSLLKTLSNGSVAAAVAGVDYATLSTVASAYPFQGANNSTSTLVGFTGGLSSASTTLTGPFVFANATGTNATTTALAAANLVVSGNATLASTTLTGNTLLTHATTTNFAITGVTSALLKTLNNGSVVAAVAGVDYATLSTVASAYPFQGTGNSTSTLTQFNGGLTAYGSTTIGAGGQTTGLTISGGATTTGSAYITGTLGVGVNVSGSNKLDVNGSTRICANNAGCVGNTGAGDYSLSLQNNGTTNWLEILNSGGVNKGVFFGLTGNNFEQWNYQGGDILFYTNPSASNGTERLRITNQGLVGIGTSSPFSKFSVHLRDGDTNLNAFAIGSSTASATTTLLRVDNTGALSLVGNITSTSGSASVLPYASTTALTVSGSFYGAGLATCNTATDKVLWADGQFSCGTDLNTGGGGNTFSFSNNYGVLAAATSSAIWAQSGIFASSTSHFASLDAINATSTYLTASVANFGGSGGTTTITANGNVGLGSTTPSQKLTVVGGTILQTASGDPTLAATITTSNNSYQTVIAGHYAYTADFAGGLRITDITDPKNPAAVASYAYNGGSSAAVSIAVAGKYAYIGDSSAGLIIFDVSNPASPTIVSSTALLDAPWSMAVSGRYLYVADGDDQVMYIIDISNPAAPTVAGTFAPGGGSAQPYAVAVEGKYAYLGDIGNSRVYVVDISNPAVPVTTASYTGGGGLAPVGLYAAGRYLYVADAGLGFYSLDVSNAGATPTLVGSYGSGSTYYGVAVAGLYAYVGDNGGNVVVLNLSRPTAPTLVGTYATGATPLHMAVSGKYAYVSTDGGGVKVIDINGASLPAATIGALDTSMLNVGDDLRVGNNLYAGGSLNVGISGIYSRGTISAYVASSTQTNPVVASFMGGNVGIGSSTPSATLSLLTSQTAGQAAYINGNSLTSGIGLGITVNSNAMTSTGRAFAIVDNAFGSLSTPNFEIDRYGQTGIRTFGILSSDTSLTVGTGFDAFKGIVVKGNSVTQTGNLQEWQNSAGVVLGAVTATGRVGIGSSTPAALFAISDNTANGNTTAFLISSSTASATTTLLSVSNQGNLTVAGSSTVASVLNAGGAINAASTLNIGGIITSTATAANTLPYASTTAVTVSGTASTTALVVSNLGSGAGNCLTPTSAGTITTQTCAAFAYPFPSNATSTLLTFSGGISVGGTLTVSGGRVDYSAAATSTIVNNTAYAWTLATSTTATPLINVTTTTGTETVTIGVAGSDVLIGGVGAAANLVFEESSTIHGQGGNTLTFGTTGDKINFAVNVGFGTTTPLAAIHADVTGTGDTAILGVGRNESFAGTVMGAASYRSASSAYYLFAGISDYHGTPDNEFLMRGDGNGFLDGSWSTPADFAEWTRVVGTTTDYQVGDLVAFATTSEFGPSDRRAALGTRGATPLGVVTLKPGVVGVSFDLSDDVTDAATGSTTKFVKTGSRTQKQMEEAYNAKMVALVGYTPIHVSTENGPLKSGDGITFSSIPGVGMKAGPGDSVVGYAFEEFDPEEGKMGTHDRELPTYDDSTTFKPMTTATTTPDGEDVWSGWVFAHVEKGYVPNLSLTDMLASTTAAMDDETRQEIDGFWTGLFGKIATWLGDASNGIANLFATTVTAETLNTNKLCVDDLCITKSELQTLLNNAGTSGAPPPLPEEEQGTTTPPIETPDDDSGTSTPPIDEPADEPTVETPPDEPTAEAPAEEPPSQEPAPEETEAPAEPVAGESGEQ